MRISVLRHLDSENHKKNHSLLTATRNEEREVLKKGKECGINCASIAYTTLFYFDLTLQTLTSMKDSLLLPNLQCNMLLNSELFPNFFECS